jgi:hypothetical protein
MTTGRPTTNPVHEPGRGVGDLGREQDDGVDEDQADEHGGARDAEPPQLGAQSVDVAAQRVLNGVAQRVDGDDADRQEGQDGDDREQPAHEPHGRRRAGF